MTFTRVTKDMESAGEESEDGGGNWHKYVTKERQSFLRSKKPEQNDEENQKLENVPNQKLAKVDKPYDFHSCQR